MIRQRALQLARAILVVGLAVAGVANAEIADGDGIGIITAYYPERGQVRLGDSDVVPLSAEAARQLGDYVRGAGWPVGAKLRAKFTVSDGVIQEISISGRLQP